MSPFPALDPEPPPRPLWRAALIPGGVVASIAIVVVLVITLTGGGSSKGHPRPPSWPTQVPGEVIGWNVTAGTLLAMSPTGVVHPQGVLASHLPTTTPAVSASGFGVMSRPGHVSHLENGKLVPILPDSLEHPFHAQDQYGYSPFANDDNALVVGGLTPTDTEQSPVLINLLSGHREPMPGARADTVVGDPTRKGAWVSVTGGLPTASSSNDEQQPDARIEYRTPGKPPVTLDTAAQLEQQAGIKTSHKVELTPYPSPSGKQIAIDVLQIGPTPDEPESIVVVSPTGAVLGKMSVPSLRQVSWATSGNRLLVLQSSNLLWTWAPGSPPSPQIHLNPALGSWGACLFSPSGSYIICSAFANQGVTHWALVRLSDRAVAVEPAVDIPLDWSP